MADEVESFTQICDKAPKRPRRESKRKKEQRLRHGPKDPVIITCTHGKKKVYQCESLSEEEVRSFNTEFYKSHNKLHQDRYILRNIAVSKVKRPTKITPRERQRKRGEKPEISYFIWAKGKGRVRVCREKFLKTLNVGRRRVEGVGAHYYKTGDERPETRGGDRKSNKYKEKREAVVDFIRKLKARESHYSRKKTTKLYLPSELKNVKTLWTMYNNAQQEDSKRVKLTFFRKIFHSHFHLGFGTPKTDACSYCHSHKLQIKSATTGPEKQRLITEQTVHMRRSNAFYKLVRERRQGLYSITFDHQQNQVLPKVPDQQAYYSRQIYVFNFTICEGGMDSTLPREKVFVYTWTEADMGKHSSACASAVYHHLNNANLDNIDTVRLLCDGCGGQNKNSTFLYMTGHWLCNDAPSNIQSVELVFPVRGHSFLPCDRVFGNIERDIKATEVIFSPDEYHDIYDKYGHIRKMFIDWKVLNFKDVADKVLKKPLPFKIQENKRFYVRKSGRSVKISAELFYNSILCEPRAVLKRGCSMRNDVPSYQPGVTITDAKIKDVNNLLVQHAGEDWRKDGKLQFIKGVLESNVARSREICDHADDENCCDCVDSDIELNQI